jgi:hypothetical protein
MAIVRKTTSLRDQLRAVGVYFVATVALQVVLSFVAANVPLGLLGVSAWALSLPAMLGGYAPPGFVASVVGVVFLVGPGIAFLLGRSGTRPALAGAVAAIVTEVCASTLVFVGFEFFGVSI